MMHTARGQSLIELLVAMVVITIGLMAASAFVFSNIRLQEISADRVIATNLAREGIEYSKALRDSNWLAGVAFDTGMYGSGNDYSGVPYVNTSGVFQSFDFTPNSIDTDTSYSKIVRSSTAAGLGMYIQGAPGGVPVVGTSTRYFRFMEFGPICADGTKISTNGVDCTGHGVKTGVHVTSTVMWKERGTAAQARRESVIVDELYDWR